MRILSTSVLLAFSIVSATRLSLSKMDNFDKDKNTVSEYDHMHFYPTQAQTDLLQQQSLIEV